MLHDADWIPIDCPRSRVAIRVEQEEEDVEEKGAGTSARDSSWPCLPAFRRGVHGTQVFIC